MSKHLRRRDKWPHVPRRIVFLAWLGYLIIASIGVLVIRPFWADMIFIFTALFGVEAGLRIENNNRKPKEAVRE